MCTVSVLSLAEIPGLLCGIQFYSIVITGIHITPYQRLQEHTGAFKMTQILHAQSLHCLKGASQDI